jgi:hypothetical protein
MVKNNTVHILYVSGFGSRYDATRRFLLRFWRIYGISTELVAMRWDDGVDYDTKLRLLHQAINKNKDKNIVLIGESAGASIVINAYANRSKDIYRAMSLCGKNQGAKTVAGRFYSKNPAFEKSIRMADDNIQSLDMHQKEKFTSIYALYDPVIPAHESIVPGSRQVKLWTFGHLVSILLSLSLLSFILVREARR